MYAERVKMLLLASSEKCFWDSWEDGNPGFWGSSPQYQPGSPRSRAYEAPTPGSGWANTPGGSYSDASTPRDTGITRVQDLKSSEINFAGKVRRKVWWWGFSLKM
ncbi:putative transcription elongation factor SPT5 [Helianthus annuus]|nr:putative transcription elongation factor SPT5 [Helianthus annuus]KAJ0804989.1 putative transcription elongation factor SPT5 [Helianthus annuus]